MSLETTSADKPTSKADAPREIATDTADRAPTQREGAEAGSPLDDRPAAGQPDATAARPEGTVSETQSALEDRPGPNSIGAGTRSGQGAGGGAAFDDRPGQREPAGADGGRGLTPTPEVQQQLADFREQKDQRAQGGVADTGVAGAGDRDSGAGGPVRPDEVADHESDLPTLPDEHGDLAETSPQDQESPLTAESEVAGGSPRVEAADRSDDRSAPPQQEAHGQKSGETTPRSDSNARVESTLVERQDDQARAQGAEPSVVHRRTPDLPGDDGTGPDRVQSGFGLGQTLSDVSSPVDLRVAEQSSPGAAATESYSLGEAQAETPSLAEVWNDHPGEYVPPPVHSIETLQPFEHPDAWSARINGDGAGVPGRDNNCGDCTRATERTWRGSSEQSAALSDPYRSGESREVMENWIGAEAQAKSYDEVARQLLESGPGSSAMVGQYWQGGGGHWFNAVNHEGTVLAVDGQSGQHETWPPSEDGLGWDESYVRNSFAIVRARNGKVLG